MNHSMVKQGSQEVESILMHENNRMLANDSASTTQLHHVSSSGGAETQMAEIKHDHSSTSSSTAASVNIAVDAADDRMQQSVVSFPVVSYINYSTSDEAIASNTSVAVASKTPHVHEVPQSPVVHAKPDDSASLLTRREAEVVSGKPPLKAAAAAAATQQSQPQRPQQLFQTQLSQPQQQQPQVQ